MTNLAEKQLANEFKRFDTMDFHELLKELNLEGNDVTAALQQVHATYEVNPQKATETLRKLGKVVMLHVFEETLKVVH
jgi:hypothetical protein